MWILPSRLASNDFALDSLKVLDASCGSVQLDWRNSRLSHSEPALQLRAQALEILGEVEAGIPIMRLLGEQSFPLVTKAGGFGSPAAIGDALVKVKQYV